MKTHRRAFLRASAAFGVSVAWASSARCSRSEWRERREHYPQGVASGDPDAHSVILWTRRPYAQGTRELLTVEIAKDEAFEKVVAQASAPVSAAADWTARVLIGGLEPATTYWYRFTDVDGNGSRVGRTLTAPMPDDPRAVNFAFVSCQSINEGKLNAYRRMIYEDERAPATEKLGFVLHLGDFIYEVVEYPDEVKTRFDRTVYEVVRIPDGKQVGNFHIPLTVEGYRAIYQAYLNDPDLQDARARWPFVAIWDNHEFSWQGWQSVVKAGSFEQAGQTVKVAANQAWFEYMPARVARTSESLERFDPPKVENVPITEFDSDGLGTELNNLAAIHSLRGYRSLRYGRNLDVIITDQRSYRSADPFRDPSLEALGGNEFMGMFPESVMQVLDGGRAFDNGKPPAEVGFNDARVPNPQCSAPPQTILGAEQKAWFKDQLRSSTAVWKIWANSLGTLESRVDPHNLPEGLTQESWPASTFAMTSSGDFGTAWAERAEIYRLVRDAKITGFAIVSGDRHSFWAGYASAELPPGKFEPVGLSFVGGSISSPGLLEAYEHILPKKAPLRPLFLVDREAGAKPDGTINMLLRHGVRACFEYAKNFDLEKARSLSNPDLSPHLEFVDMGGHGFSKVRLSADEMRTEFVCIPRPIVRSESPDGGPIRYRVSHTAALWKDGERPRLRVTVLEGDVGLSI